MTEQRCGAKFGDWAQSPALSGYERVPCGLPRQFGQQDPTGHAPVPQQEAEK